MSDQSEASRSDEWDEQCRRVTQEMAAAVSPFSTPISISLKNGEVGKHLGTGSYHEMFGIKLLLSCEHVLGAREKNDIAHKLQGFSRYVLIGGAQAETAGTIDAAAAAISPQAWNDIRHTSQSLPLTRIDISHRPVPSELLFVHGFAAENSQFIYDELRTDGTSYLAREASLPSHKDVDGRYHFALEYRRDAAEQAFGERGLPDPHAMSGSLVWNTRFVQCSKENRNWSPAEAVVTGLLWSWPSEQRIVATRIEYVRSFLLSTLSAWFLANRANETTALHD